MALDILANYAEATVTSGGTTAPAAGTVQTWTVTTTENWPVLASSGQQMRVMDKADLTATSGYEIMLLTANANGTGVSWTVTRGVGGTTPWAHAPNFTVVPVQTATNSQPVDPSGGLPRAAKRSTIPRWADQSAVTTYTSGTLLMALIWLVANETYLSVTAGQGSTGIGTTGRWFAIYDDELGSSSGTAYSLLASSAEDTGNWAAGVSRTISFSSAYTPARTGYFYMALLGLGASSFKGAAQDGVLGALAPVTCGVYGSSLASLPNPAGTPTVGATWPLWLVN